MDECSTPCSRGEDGPRRVLSPLACGDAGLASRALEARSAMRTRKLQLAQPLEGRWPFPDPSLRTTGRCLEPQCVGSRAQSNQLSRLPRRARLYAVVSRIPIEIDRAHQDRHLHGKPISVWLREFCSWLGATCWHSSASGHVQNDVAGVCF
jgi:hypothetical protein